MTNSEFERYYLKYQNVIKAIARKFAGADADLFDDLTQQGAIGLFEADLRKPFKNEDAFLRNVIRNRIVDHIRWLDPERYERLDKHLAQGAQVVKDPETSDIMIIRPDARRLAREQEGKFISVKGRACLRSSSDEDYDG